MPLQRGITAGERSRGNSRALSLVEKLGVCLFVRSSTWSRVLLKLQGHYTSASGWRPEALRCVQAAR